MFCVAPAFLYIEYEYSSSLRREYEENNNGSTDYDVNKHACILFPKGRGNIPLKEGLYLNSNAEMTPYVCFDAEKNTWRCGHIAMSYALGGTYERSGNKIGAKKDGH
jgi:hypothetical protein